MAFLLGWTVSELLGHLRKGVRPAQSAPITEDYAPRIIPSNGAVDKPADAFVFAAHRLIQFWRQTGFEKDEKTSALNLEIYVLPNQIRAWLNGEEKTFYSAGQFRTLLNEWSLQVWARLNGVSADCARAFSEGMSLADTYWYMRLPTRRPKELSAAQMREEDWRTLLSRYRLDVEGSRLKGLDRHLPRYVSRIIRNHLNEWSIGTELYYEGSRLKRSRHRKKAVELARDDEKDLQRALGRQMENWEAMLFGFREAETFLPIRDQRLVRIARWMGLLVVFLLTAFFLLLVSALIGFFAGAALLPQVNQSLTGKEVEVSDWLSVVSLLWTILFVTVIPIVLRAAYRFTRDAHQWIHDWLMVFFITRRTLVKWDRYLRAER